MAAMVFGTMALAFDAYFSDAQGQKPLGKVQEGNYVYIVVKDADKAACGIAEFLADIVIFDFKTGAWLEYPGAVFRELGGIGSGLFFWVTGPGSNTKVAVQIGSRADFADVPTQTHVLGNISAAITAWEDGNWEYLDADIQMGLLPAARAVQRLQLDAEGRFENNDTLILLVGDLTDSRNVDQDQLKIIDTVSALNVTPGKVKYGCGAACENIVVTIKDADENLNCNEVEYVPVFVIINPGSWDGDVTNFCSLILRGGYDEAGVLWDEPIRWYNIYEEARFIDYDGAPWWNPDWPTTVLRAVFFAAETSVSSGEFKLDLGNLEDFQEALGLGRDARLPPGTTIAFYYIDPNDFDDMDLATIEVDDRPHSQVFITDASGVPISEVKIGHQGLYIRVYDADANVEACCQDKVVVHICDPHNEDDSEYIVIDEISNNSGIFFTQSGVRLEPLWDAVNGYQLVFDDWRIQAFNEDTIFVRYNSVDYMTESLNALGDGDPNDGFFPPEINYDAPRNQYWDVSFAKVKVYDYQVFDGATHQMRFLDGNYQPVTKIPISGSLYLEVTDLDQNENPLLRELIFGGWNKDAVGPVDSSPVWTEGAGIFNGLPAGFFNRVVPDNLLGLYEQSITGILETVKVFMFNAQRGYWERIDLRETAIGSGVFRSTTCVLVSDTRAPGQGNLGAGAGDTIMAFYQDPSNHSDISIISIKVSEGGAGEVVPPVVTLKVEFDRTTYYPGDTVTITVTDEQYSGAAEIVGTNVLVLMDKDGSVITSWNRLEAVAGQPGKFRVTYVLPETVKPGTITAKYTDPYMPTRVAQGQATVQPKTLSNVTGIAVSPNPFKTSTTFTIQAEPAGAVAEKITIAIYDLTGAKVAEITGANTASVTWNGGNLRNGAYIYVAIVEGGSPRQTWTFKGFVYIER
jgi:hypothetical protein